MLHRQFRQFMLPVGLVLCGFVGLLGGLRLLLQSGLLSLQLSLLTGRRLALLLYHLLTDCRWRSPGSLDYPLTRGLRCSLHNSMIEVELNHLLGSPAKNRPCLLSFVRIQPRLPPLGLLLMLGFILRDRRL